MSEHDLCWEWQKATDYDDWVRLAARLRARAFDSTVITPGDCLLLSSIALRRAREYLPDNEYDYDEPLVGIMWGLGLTLLVVLLLLWLL